MMLATVTLLALAPAAVSEAPPPVAIVHVGVIDTKGGPTRTGRTVVVSGGKVALVVPDEAYSPGSPDAKVIDGRGKFLIPGLWDMHVHATRPESLKLDIANGVTGVRVMWGNPAMAGFPIPHTAWKRQIEAGQMVGPRLVLASNILDGPKPIWPGTVALKDEAEARKAVRAAKASGAEFVKVYSLLAPEVFRAIADECKAQGIPFAGHIPTLVSAREASELGQRSMEHLYGVFASCSPREEEMLRARRAILDESQGEWVAARPKLALVDAQLRDSYRDETAEAFFARLKANETHQCPTLTVLRAIGSLDDPKFIDDPRIKYIDPFTRLYWNPKSDFRLRSMKPEDFAAQRKSFGRSLELVGKLNRAGVPILAGTDEGNPYVFPGSGLHDELGLLVKAGMTPLQALQSATIGPARFLRREEVSGTVEAGKEADLVLLDADPLADIANTTRIHAVFARGKLLDRPALDALLKSVEEMAKPGTRPDAPARPVGGVCPDF